MSGQREVGLPPAVVITSSLESTRRDAFLKTWKKETTLERRLICTTTKWEER